MSPLWTVMIVLLVLAVVAYLVAKPLHKYLTDRKTEKLIRESKLDSGLSDEKEKPGSKKAGEEDEAAEEKGEEKEEKEDKKEA